MGGTLDEPQDCCDCIGGYHDILAPDTVNSTIVRCGPGYKDGSALCSLCEDGYALRANQCVQCDGQATAIILPLVLFPIILLFIQRLTSYFESCEISLAFLQFLGVYAGFGVRWVPSFQSFINVFAIANVDVDLLGLACGEIDFATMWLIQAILLPLLYLAFVLVDLAVSWGMLQLAKGRIPPVPMFIKWGWRPTRSFSLGSISDRYVPHGLMYLNIYYLTGVSKAFQLLQCTDPQDGGGSFLDAAPSLVCWQGEHQRLMGINSIALMLYVILVPAGYCYILLRLAPKEGLHSTKLFRVFGFLWSRFEDRCWYWELLEITLRKMPLVIISTFIPSAIYKCIMGILLIGALMAANFVKEPYVAYRHDLLDQAVATAEVLLFLFGILVEYRAEGNQTGGIIAEVENLCYGVIALVLAFSLFQLGQDIVLYYRTSKSSRLMNQRRARASTPLGGSIFQLDGPLVGRFVDGAAPLQLETLRKVEAMLAKVARRVEKPSTRRKEDQRTLAKQMATAVPHMLDWLIVDEHAQKQLQAFTSDLVAGKDAQDFSGATISDLLNEAFVKDHLPTWLAESATRVERQSISNLLKGVADIVPTYAGDALKTGDNSRREEERSSLTEIPTFLTFYVF